MKLPHLFNNTCYTQPNTTSYWPSCTQQPKTLSFSSILRDDTLFQPGKNAICHATDPPKSSSALIEDLLKEDGGETIERVIRELKSDHRLFFEHDKSNDSVLGKDENSNGRYGSHVNQNKSVTLLSMESTDPYLDFKKSMEEMVEAHNGVIDWYWLHELLGCYLKVNGTSHHEFIIGAFLDMLVSLNLDSLGLSFSSAVASPSTSSSSNTSCCSSSNSATDETAAGP